MGPATLWSRVWMLLATCSAALGFRALVVFPIEGRSHSILGEGFVNILLDSGHKVTYITPFEMKNKSKDLTQIVLDIDLTAVIAGDKDLMKVSALLTGNSPFRNPFGMTFFGTEYANVVLNHTKVRKLMEDPAQQFDLVIAEWFFSELYAGFAALYDCPLVWSSSMDVHSMVIRVMDEVPNPSYTPDIFSAYRAPFTFFQRANELWIVLKRLLMNEFIIMPKSTEIYDKTFGAAATALDRRLPSYSEVVYSASMMMMNGHPSLGDAPRLPQNVKEVAGYHIKQPGPLPQDIEKIMDEATDGVIYFSLGSNVKSKDLPETMKRELLKVFGELKQTVLWKFEADAQDVPENVVVRAWFPQHAVLNHPNVLVFITHGGLLSTTETVHFGVPAVVVPLFGDQFLNAHVAARRGFAVRVDFTYDLARDLQAAIREVLSNPKYKDRVRELSNLYHDRPIPPDKEVIYWLEYTARHGRLPHLRSPALYLAWYQRLYLDLLAAVSGALLAISLALRVALRKVRGGCKSKKD